MTLKINNVSKSDHRRKWRKLLNFKWQRFSNRSPESPLKIESIVDGKLKLPASVIFLQSSTLLWKFSLSCQAFEPLRWLWKFFWRCWKAKREVQYAVGWKFGYKFDNILFLVINGWMYLKIAHRKITCHGKSWNHDKERKFDICFNENNFQNGCFTKNHFLKGFSQQGFGDQGRKPERPGKWKWSRSAPRNAVDSKALLFTDTIWKRHDFKDFKICF